MKKARTRPVFDSRLDKEVHLSIVVPTELLWQSRDLRQFAKAVGACKKNLEHCPPNPLFTKSQIRQTSSNSRTIVTA